MLKGLIRSAGAAALVLTASTSVSAQEAGGVAGKGVDRATQRPSVGAQVHTAGTQGGSPSRTPGWADDPPELSSLVEFAREQSDLRVVLERYIHDKAAIERRYEIQYSPVRHERLRRFHEDLAVRLAELPFGSLNHEGQIDYVLLRNRITFDQAMLQLEEERWAQIEPLLPFAARIRALQETRHDRRRADPRATADLMDDVASEVERLIAALEGEVDPAEGTVARAGGTPAVALRAVTHLQHLSEVLEDYHRFYSGYDPLYTWWVSEPYGRLSDALTRYGNAIRLHVGGIGPGERNVIVGDPVLADGLAAYLAMEMIPYTAEELIDIGWREFERTEIQFKKVSRAMGYGDDWQAALEHTKNLAPSPGEKPWVIFDIARYSESFIEGLGNITLPPLAKEVWRLSMQTPERQLQNPFFSGGEVTRVSYPTDGMRHQDKLMSMRGNTPHFNFPTVQHELIPGHHLQSFMSNRFNSHRGAVARTPFWGEGWALYWELLLWDEDFARNDPDKIGTLFWRMHRAARIIFSLNFQLGEWSPEEAIDFLVERVGHERANAEAEVRRSVQANPLYQIAYLIGGLQFQALHRELVESGSMTAREFHDSVLQGGRMPVELVRSRLTRSPLTPDHRAEWRFYRTTEVVSWTGDP